MSNQPNITSVNKEQYKGEVIYIYAFDIAYDMKRERLQTLLGQPVSNYSIGPSKRSPKQVLFYRTQMVILPTEQRQSMYGTVTILKRIKLFNIGAISIQVRVPFTVSRVEDLVAYHELKFDGTSLADEIYELAESVKNELGPYCIRPVQRISQSEHYTVFCFYETPETMAHTMPKTEDWLKTNRRQVAALLTEEPNAANLSEQEVNESTDQYLAYYKDDLVVVDWDAALIIAKPGSFDDVLHIMELASVQLVEVAAYDRILDGSLETAYRDLVQWHLRIRRETQQNLREIRIDMARLNDELSNITKFFGDWYLAKIYQQISSRFHLTDWHKIIQDKLKTLGDLYNLIQQDWVNFWMVILETTIVLLFIIDLIILLMGSRQ